jgi:hypothetical protein
MRVEAVEPVGPRAGPAAAPAPPGAGGPASPGWYEFTPEQGAVIGGLAGRMRFVGAGLLLVGLGGAGLGATQGSVVAAALGLALAAFGYFSLAAGASLGQIQRTQGRDVTHLMDALRDLRGGYGVLAWVVAVVGVVLAIILVVAIAGGVSNPAPPPPVPEPAKW